MKTCEICGKGADAGNDRKIAVGELISDKYAGAGVGGTVRYRQTYSDVRWYTFFVCKGCRRRENLTMGFALIAAIVGAALLVQKMGAFEQGISGIIFGCLFAGTTIAFVLFLVFVGVLWLIVFGSFGGIASKLKARAKESYGLAKGIDPSSKLGTRSRIATWTETEYKKKWGG